MLHSIDSLLILLESQQGLRLGNFRTWDLLIGPTLPTAPRISIYHVPLTWLTEKITFYANSNALTAIVFSEYNLTIRINSIMRYWHENCQYVRFYIKSQERKMKSYQAQYKSTSTGLVSRCRLINSLPALVLVLESDVRNSYWCTKKFLRKFWWYVVIISRSTRQHTKLYW